MSTLAAAANAAETGKSKRPLPRAKPAALSSENAVLPKSRSAFYATGKTIASRSALLAEPVSIKADLIVIHKSQRLMRLMRNNEAIGVYRVALGKDPIGHKESQGDNKTPEGTYFVDYMKRNSDFHRGIGLSYPSSWDRAVASVNGVPPGGAIMIHGLPNGYSATSVGHPIIDWTAGCIAVTNQEVEEIWAMVREGVEVKILP